MTKQEYIIQSFEILQIDPEYVIDMIYAIRTLPIEEARQVYELFKKDVKRKYNKCAKKYHPDHGGDVETFKKFSQIMKVLNEIEIKAGRASLYYNIFQYHQ